MYAKGHYTFLGRKMKFSEGEEVLAKNPNTGEYNKGKILSIRGERYKVQFEMGIEQYVHSTDIKVFIFPSNIRYINFECYAQFSSFSLFFFLNI